MKQSLPNHSDFLGLPISKSYDAVVQLNPVVINCINAYSFYCFNHDADFREAVMESVNLPDGIIIVWGSKFLYNENLTRLTGFDVLMQVLGNTHDLNLKKLMFVGSTENVLSKIGKRLTSEFPHIDYKTIGLPFRNEFTLTDAQPVIESIQAFSPDAIFVGLSAPKQEKFSYAYLRHFSNVKYIFNVGAAFEFFAGTEPHAPRFISKIGMEGFYRTLFNPVKHLKKDIKSYPYILKRLFLANRNS